MRCASIALVACALGGRADGQIAPSDGGAIAGAACTGDTVTAIDIRVHPASSASARDEITRAKSEVFRSRFATTRPGVVRAYLRLHVGKACTEFDRSESERFLRAQPFIASAIIRASPDGPGRVRMDVDVVDEMPVVIDGGIQRGQLASLTLGTQNFQGRGLAVSARVTRGFAYRDGLGLAVAQYGVFGSPYHLEASAERNPLGTGLSLDFARPFLTTLQRTAFGAGIRAASGYGGVLRPAGPSVALKTHRVSYDVGWVRRLGKLDRRHTAGFVGGAVLGESIRIDSGAMIVSDSGLVRAGASDFGAAYPTLSAVRIAAIGGVRSIRFVTVRGFDALAAQQDVGVGIQLHLLAGPSIWATGNRGELFAAGDLYAGIGHDASFASVHMVSEARGKYDSPNWEAMASSARLSWYVKPSRALTHITSVDVAAVRRLSFPAQLTFRDPDGGVAGFAAARAGGGGRAVVGIEERFLTGWFRSRADFAVAAFANAGKLWAGDVPYGQTTTIRQSLGLSLLGAFPAGSKRMYRLDVAFPLNPERGGSRVELRVSALDRTRLLWLEPRDVARVRSGAVPTRLMKW